MAIGGGSGVIGTIAGVEGLGYGCGKCDHFGLIIFLLAPALPCPFLGSIGGIILWGWDSGMGLVVPSPLAWDSGLSAWSRTLSVSCMLAFVSPLL